MVEIKFKSFTYDDNNKSTKIDYNKKLLRLCLSKVMYSNPRKSLNSIFENEKIIHMVNEYIFELLSYETIKYYKSGTKRTLRCLYDEKPDGETKSDNREFIQDVIKFHLLRRNQDYLDDFEEEIIIETYMIKQKEKKPIYKCDGEEFNSKEELDEYLDNLDDGVDEYLAKQEEE